jgi:hypothetical protein
VQNGLNVFRVESFIPGIFKSFHGQLFNFLKLLLGNTLEANGEESVPGLGLKVGAGSKSVTDTRLYQCSVQNRCWTSQQKLRENLKINLIILQPAFRTQLMNV